MNKRTVNGTRHILVRDFILDCEIGAFSHERGKRQRVCINLDLDIREEGTALGDDLRKVVSYGELVDQIRVLAQGGHINLVETLAERIAETCLVDRRVASAKVRVEKLDVYPDIAGVGVEIERFNQSG